MFAIAVFSTCHIIQDHILSQLFFYNVIFLEDMKWLYNQDLKNSILEKSSFLRHIYIFIFSINVLIVYYNPLLHIVQIKKWKFKRALQL